MSRKHRARERKEKRRKTIYGLTMVFLMVFSIAGFIASYHDGSGDTGNSFRETYSGVEYTFTPRVDNIGNSFFEVTSHDSFFTTFYPPSTLDNSINVDIGSKTVLKNSQIFLLTFDPENSDLNNVDYLRFDLRRNLPPGKNFVEGVSKPSENYNLPVITCENASFQVPVIHITNSTNTSVSFNNNCVTMEIYPFDILRIRDLFVYSLRGIV